MPSNSFARFFGCFNPSIQQKTAEKKESTLGRSLREEATVSLNGVSARHLTMYTKASMISCLPSQIFFDDTIDVYARSMSTLTEDSRNETTANYLESIRKISSDASFEEDCVIEIGKLPKKYTGLHHEVMHSSTVTTCLDGSWSVSNCLSMETVGNNFDDEYDDYAQAGLVL